ncbi:rod shape-determining protein RodA [Olsenella sp. AF16-14LB]|jgi:rod shape determining protein RodA|uniref:FtsW/RodA/SpoVE family cell cycle protein n=1 Tax=Atopobiaceae TaxID=1643824 RepID=UPI0009DE48FE|nr:MULTISPECIES: FtsW/RodA/SpoVE family cell cycle protein [unclassified Olsenella]RGJ47510.1 rod shape-determining protein RodA [Olsenella sp. TM06-36]RGS53130.1 rod shape-determining protein RodA [Olsenella sp. AF21-51]RGU51740.1 rod shape-determining protein RodA [Olsenella sp. AF16-14LB]RGU82969.1 rod shape-determining protein RodA [Olsenella sp. AF15-43LB]RHB56970.1 rod shape-determining protein RodA [Olsenella sp. AM39-30AC]
MANMARRQGLLNSASNHLNRGSSRRATTGSGRLGKTLGGLYLSQLIPALLLVVYGVVVIWSASLTIPEANFPRHLVGIAMGLVGAVLVWRYDYRNLQGMTRTLLIIACILMIAPKIPGLSYSAKGITGWVKVPGIGITFQPSELAKLVVIYLMAALGAQYNGKIESLRDYVRLCAILLVPFGLILLQPDLGTGLVLLVFGATIIICSGAKRSWVLVTIALIVVGAAAIIVTSMLDGFPHILKTYQLNRLIVFVDPSVDPTNNGYNLQQAKIAVGSGGLLGKGIGGATQAGNGFLPEAQTDFVFALLAEEFGFVGGVVLLGLFAWMILSTILLGMRCESMFGKLVCVGCAAMWTFQVLEEVGMCMGIMPITGIPLPFISYGATSMIAQLMAVGMVQSVWRHRQKSA